MTLGASNGFRATLFGDCGGVRNWKDSSGHERGEDWSGEDVYVGIDFSCALMKDARFAE